MLKKEKFSIRKYSIGACSVLLAATLLGIAPAGVTVPGFETQIVHADDTIPARTITGEVKIWDNADARQFNTGFLTGSNGSIPNGGTKLSGYTGVDVHLLDENGAILQTINSGADGTLGHFTFSDLADGTYYVEIADTNRLGVPHEILQLPALQSLGKPFQQAKRSEAIVVQDGKVTVGNMVDNNNEAVKEVFFGVVRQSYGLEVSTRVGSFKFETNDGLQDFGTSVKLFEGGLGYFEQNNNRFATIKGILYGDHPNDILNALPAPTLSDDEKAFGYEFVGWGVDPADPVMQANYPELAGRLLTQEEALNLFVKGDIKLRAVFNFPRHTVTFATDEEKGSINGDVAVSGIVEGNTNKVSELGALPVAEPKEGYEFVGWFTDAGTTNVIPKDTISDTVVTRDIVYYAKYRSVAKETSAKPVINPITDGSTEISGIGVAGATVTVTFPDGTTGKTTVNPDNTWTITAPAPLTTGQNLSAEQQEKNKNVSPTVSATVVPTEALVSENPIIDAMTEGNAAVTGNTNQKSKL